MVLLFTYILYSRCNCMLSDSQWDLVCDKKSLPQTTGTIFFLGVLVGGLTFGYLCDKYVSGLSNVFTVT